MFENLFWRRRPQPAEKPLSEDTTVIPVVSAPSPEDQPTPGDEREAVRPWANAEFVEESGEAAAEEQPLYSASEALPEPPEASREPEPVAVAAAPGEPAPQAAPSEVEHSPSVWEQATWDTGPLPLETAVMPAAAIEAAPEPAPEPAAAAAMPERISAIAAVGRVLVLPRSTFVRVKAREVAAWIPAFAVLGVGAVAKTGVALFMVQRTPGPLPATGAVALWTSLTVVGPIAYAALAAAFFTAFARAFGEEGDFTRFLSFTSLALVPIAIRDLIQAAYMLAVGRPVVNPGLSALVRWTPAVGHRLLYALTGRVDAFTLWSTALLIVGALCVAGFGRAKTWLVTVLLIVLTVIVAAIPAFVAGPMLVP